MGCRTCDEAQFVDPLSSLWRAGTLRSSPTIEHSSRRDAATSRIVAPLGKRGVAFVGAPGASRALTEFLETFWKLFPINGKKFKLEPNMELWLRGTVDSIMLLRERGRLPLTYFLRLDKNQWSRLESFMEVLERPPGRNDPSHLIGLLRNFETANPTPSTSRKSEEPLLCGEIFDMCVTLPACVWKYGGLGRGGSIYYGRCYGTPPGCACMETFIPAEVLLMLLLLVGTVAGSWFITRGALELLRDIALAARGGLTV